MLKSTLHALYNKRYQCSACLQSCPGQPDRLKKIRALNYCEEIGPEYRHMIRDENSTIHFSTCIGNFFSPGVMHWVEVYDMYDKGVMPFSGNLMDQPSKLIDTMRIIRSYKLRQQEIEHKKAMQKQKQGMKRGR